MKYLVRTAKIVERKLKALIPDKFGLVFDGWSMGGEHYIAIFLLWCQGTDVCIRLICCDVQDEIDEDTGFTAEDIDYFFDELDILDRSDVRVRVLAATAPGATTADIANNPIDFVSGDNTATNPKLALSSTDVMHTSSTWRLIILLASSLHHQTNDSEESVMPRILTRKKLSRQLVTKID